MSDPFSITGVNALRKAAPRRTVPQAGDFCRTGKRGSSAGKENATALVLASTWRLSYRTLRCAARCFDRIYVLGTKEARPLSRSLSCQSFRELPFEEGFGSRSISLINRLCDELLVECIIPSDAATTRFLGESAAMLERKCYPVPDPETFDLLNDKSSFISLCQDLDIPTPSTEVFSDKQQLVDRLQAGDLQLPLMAKPLNLEGGRGVTVLRAGKALGTARRLTYRPIMAQQYIRGRDLCAFYLCRKGKTELEVLYRNGGHFIEFIEHPEIGRQCRKIIEAVNYDGVIGFDIRQSESNDLYFLECNPRVWYNMELVMLAGCNFVEVGLRPPTFGQQALEANLAGEVVVRSSGLLRKLPGPGLGSSARLAALSYLASDFPMMVSIALDKAVRVFFKETI
jgi:hypothetical protein